MDIRSHLSLNEMLTGAVNRLKSIKRFSNSYRLRDESVAEHSFCTALYTMLICMDLEAQGVRIETKVAVMRALVHDVEESCSGDFIRTFKHSSKRLSQAIEQASEIFAKQIFEHIVQASVTRKRLFWLWKEAKAEDLEGAVVDLADFLSVLAYIASELRMGNRAIVQDNANSLNDYADRFIDKKFKLLTPYVSQAHRLLEECQTLAAGKEVRCDF